MSFCSGFLLCVFAFYPRFGSWELVWRAPFVQPMRGTQTSHPLFVRSDSMKPAQRDLREKTGAASDPVLTHPLEDIFERRTDGAEGPGCCFSSRLGEQD